MRLEEFPGTVKLDIGNNHLSYSESGCYFPLGESLLQKFSYFVHLCYRELARLSSFFRRISHVVLIRADEQVVWIATRRIVASVKDKIGVRINAASDQPNDSSGNKCFCATNRDIAIATSDSTAIPSPAFIVRFYANFVPKSIPLAIGKTIKRQWLSVHGRILSLRWI
jgi:hypothetical protein